MGDQKAASEQPPLASLEIAARNGSEGLLMDAERLIEILLDRIERNARSADKAWRRGQQARDELARTEQVLDISQEGNRRHYRDMKAVEAKIAEWSEYGAALRAAVDDINRKRMERGRPLIGLPPIPGPLETEIPF